MNRLDNASDILNKSKSYIIRLLLSQIIGDYKSFGKSWSRIQYQGRDAPLNWYRFHLTLREDEYECYLDLRKIYKMSLSFIIALAVRMYLDSLLKKLKNIEYYNRTDNYLYRNYMILQSITDGIISWTFFWGIPDLIKRYHPLIESI